MPVVDGVVKLGVRATALLGAPAKRTLLQEKLVTTIILNAYKHNNPHFPRLDLSDSKALVPYTADKTNLATSHILHNRVGAQLLVHNTLLYYLGEQRFNAFLPSFPFNQNLSFAEHPVSMFLTQAQKDEIEPGDLVSFKRGKESVTGVCVSQLEMYEDGELLPVEVLVHGEQKHAHVQLKDVKEAFGLRSMRVMEAQDIDLAKIERVSGVWRANLS
jgi:hypothetical protein